MRLFYRAYLGLLQMIGLLLLFISNRLTSKALKNTFNKKGIPTPEEIRESMKIQTFGYGVEDIPELYDLPSMYTNFKMIQVLLKLKRLHVDEQKELRDYYFLKKQYSMIFNKKFRNKDFALELELYTHMYENNLF